MERGCYFLWAPPPELPREPEDEPREAEPEEPRDEEPRDALPDDLPDEDEPARAPLDRLDEGRETVPLVRPEEGFAYVPPEDGRE